MKQFKNLINPNWNDLDVIKENILKYESSLNGKIEVLNDDSDPLTEANYGSGGISTKITKTSIKHRDGIYMYNGSKYASISYDLMISQALIDLMFKQDIKGGNDNISGVFGYVNLNSVALKFIVDYFDKRFIIQSYHMMSSDKKMMKIKNLINNLIYYGFLTKVYYVDDDKVKETDSIYALNIFDMFSGLQIDKYSYSNIKKERDNFIKNNPNINYKNYIKRINPSNIKRISINDLECVNVYLVTIIKVYKEELTRILCGDKSDIKLNVSLLAKEHNCTRRSFEYKIKDLVRNEDLIETRKGYYILNPERYCV